MTDFLKELEKEFVEKGEWLKAREIANNLLAEGVPTKVIEKATGLSREELEELKKHLH
ncbi:hypothetical protein [Alicyclobacillus fructus]|uniref:hypothetical protein n=1 Tax=Alicyclobacillus fructus TaxID=2816082 RepID=UPI001A8CF06E|nr:hypothetical protein [Alicyclobacillus fructus]